MVQSYRTKQRKVILDFLFDNSDKHMTAEEVLGTLKAGGHKIGRATVYRYLEKLAEEGVLRRYTCARGGVALYEYCGCFGGSYHLKCDVCGNLQHLVCGNVAEFFSHVEADHDFIIDTKHTIFHGTCGKCGNNEEKIR